MNGNGDLNTGFFEGVEKLMEIWFTSSSNNNKTGDLRSISRHDWEKVLQEVHCQILGVLEHGEQVAYLLSESSLFVSRRRIILKTCGTTLCLQALPIILELAKNQCGFGKIADLFYSRKNFMKPDRQPHVHKTFQQEVEFLDSIIKEESAAYCLGKLNRDCWFLYTLNHPANDRLIGVQEPDQTLEILMINLDPEVMKKFYKCDENGISKSGDEVSETSGIKKIIKGSKIHAEMFDPCGYSMNGLLKDHCYWTIHITPEPTFSYVSFETNIPQEDYSDLIQNVLDLFKPERFSMTLFANYDSIVDRKIWDKQGGPMLKGCKCLDKQVAQLQNYSLHFTNYKMKNC